MAENVLDTWQKQDEHEAFDGVVELALPNNLIKLLDEVEENGGPGYEIACKYQHLLVEQYPQRYALQTALDSAKDYLGRL